MTGAVEPRYRQGRLSFAVPPTENWADTTVFTFRRTGDGAAATLTVAHERLLGKSLRMHTDQKLVWLGRNVRDFVLLECKEIPPVDGRAALELHFLFAKGEDAADVTLEERMVMIDGGDARVVVVSTAGPARTAAEMEAGTPANGDAALTHVLTSIRFDEASAPSLLPPELPSERPAPSSGPLPETKSNHSSATHLEMVPMPGPRRR